MGFKYVDGPKIEVNPIVIHSNKRQFSISFKTMGFIPILVLEKDNETMYILLKTKPFNPEKTKKGYEQNVILSKFMKGYFKPSNNELIEWSDRDKYIEWIKQSDLKSLEMQYRDGN